MSEMKKRPMRIKDVALPTNGFFLHVPYDFSAFFEKPQLDIAFFADYSQRNIAPIVDYYLDGSVSQLTNDQLDDIGKLIYQMFKNKWDKQSAVFNIEYDPISNYRDEYHETHTLTSEDEKKEEWGDEKNSTRTDDLTEVQSKGTTLTSTRTDNLNQTDTRNLTDTLQENTTSNVFGFNSSSPSGDTTGSDNYTKNGTGTLSRENTGTQKNETTGSGSDTITNTGTQKNDSTSSGNKTQNDNYSDNGTKDYTHLGNIGNHTTQYLIGQEIDLWRWNFMQEILKDVANFLTLPTYIG